MCVCVCVCVCVYTYIHTYIHMYVLLAILLLSKFDFLKAGIFLSGQKSSGSPEPHLFSIITSLLWSSEVQYTQVKWNCYEGPLLELCQCHDLYLMRVLDNFRSC